MIPPILKKPSLVQKNPLIEVKLDLQYVHISIDPASHATGIAVFSLDGKYIDSFTVKVSEGVIPTLRLYFMRKKFTEMWTERYGPDCIANLAVIEHLPPSNSAILANAGGAILSSGKISAELGYSEYITPPMWKFLARELGSRDKSPKGISALKAIGWSYPMVDSDDSADAVLIYLCSRWRKKQVIWTGPGAWLQSWYEPKIWAIKGKKEKKCKKAS